MAPIEDVLIGAALGGIAVLLGNWVVDSFRRQGADLPLACSRIEEILKMVRRLEKSIGAMMALFGHLEPTEVIRMARQLDDLHDWHAKEDEDGVKVWYVRKELVDIIRTLVREVRELRMEVARLNNRGNPHASPTNVRRYPASDQETRLDRPE